MQRRQSMAVLAGVALGIFGCTRAEAPVSTQGAEPMGLELAAEPGHRLLVLSLSRGGVSVVSDRTVTLPLPEQGGDRRMKPWRVELEDQAGGLLHAVDVPAPNVVRGEFHDGPDGGLKGVHFVSADGAFLVRVPLDSRTSRLRLRARPDSLAEEAVNAAPAQEKSRADGLVELGSVALPARPSR
jgi:hypothetical protein